MASPNGCTDFCKRTLLRTHGVKRIIEADSRCGQRMRADAWMVGKRTLSQTHGVKRIRERIACAKRKSGLWERTPALAPGASVADL